MLSFGRASAEKVNTQIPVYSLTGDEYFIALLLQRNGCPDKMTQLYDFILSNLQTHDSYHNLLFSKIYQKCKDKGMLETVFTIIENFWQTIR